MSDAEPRAFSPATLEAHPLLRRLSGQVIWLLLEQGGANEADIQAFLELWEKRKNEALAALERLRAPDATSRTAGGLRIATGSGAGCPRCAALDGLVLPAGHPSLAALCPPYALNCPARAEPLEPGHPALARALAVGDPGPAAPHGELLCPLAPAGGDWPGQ